MITISLEHLNDLLALTVVSGMLAYWIFEIVSGMVLTIGDLFRMYFLKKKVSNNDIQLLEVCLITGLVRGFSFTEEGKLSVVFKYEFVDIFKFEKIGVDFNSYDCFYNKEVFSFIKKA